MGIVLAALELNLDLAHPDLDLARGRITLHGAKGVERVIPDWTAMAIFTLIGG